MIPENFISDLVAFLDKNFDKMKDYESFKEYIFTKEGKENLIKYSEIHHTLRNYPKSVKAGRIPDNLFSDEPLSDEMRDKIIAIMRRKAVEYEEEKNYSRAFTNYKIIIKFMPNDYASFVKVIQYALYLNDKLDDLKKVFKDLFSEFPLVFGEPHINIVMEKKGVLLTDDVMESLLDTLANKTGKFIEAQDYQGAKQCLLISLLLKPNDPTFLFSVSVMDSLLNDLQGRDNYFQMFLESIPEELPKDFLGGMTLPEEVVKSAINFLQEKINILITGKNYQYALYCCQIARSITPDNLDLKRKEQNLINKIPVLLIIDGVVNIVVDLDKGYSKEIFKRCSIELFKYGKKLPKSKLELINFTWNLSMAADLEPDKIYEHGDLIVRLIKGEYSGKLNIEKKKIVSNE